MTGSILASSCQDDQGRTLCALPISTLLANEVGNGTSDARSANERKVRLAAFVRSLQEQSAGELLARLSSASTPLRAWFIHNALTNQSIAPVLRGDLDYGDPQLDLIRFAADIKWLQTKDRVQPVAAAWRRIWAYPVGDRRWHEGVFRIWRAAYMGNRLAHYVAQGLGLDAGQRHQLLTLPTQAQARERQRLRGDAMAQLRDNIYTHALTKPDKSGKKSPEHVTELRIQLWAVHVKCGRSPSVTAAALTAIRGERVTRQAVSKQLEIIERVPRLVPSLDT
jgi:hypothetical protein